MSVNLTRPVKILEDKVRSNPRLTKTEASALTGLPPNESEAGLRELVDRYECRLQVTENGDLIYDFGNLQRRGEKTFGENFEEFLEKVWLIFTYVYKAGISVILITYCLVFIVLIIALAFATNSDDRDNDSGFGLDLIGHIFLAIFQWNTASDLIYYETDRYGYRYPQYQPKTARKKSPSKGIIAAVYDFVFGPPRVKPDPLANLREAAAFIRRNNGILVTTDLKALAGWNASEAASFFAESIARYQGDIKVEDRIMYGDFDQLTRTVNTAKESEIIYYWDEYEPDFLITGNSSFHNTVIIIVNSFNLLISGLIVAGAIPLVTGWTFLLGWIPFIFSLLFFIIPACRAIKIQSAREARHWNNIRKRLMRVIFQRQGEAISIDQMMRAVNSTGQEEQLTREVVEKMLAQLKAELPGDIIYDDKGELRYAFPIIGMEMEVAGKLRSQRVAKQSLGKVVFDSEK